MVKHHEDWNLFSKGSGKTEKEQKGKEKDKYTQRTESKLTKCKILCDLERNGCSLYCFHCLCSFQIFQIESQEKRKVTYVWLIAIVDFT